MFKDFVSNRPYILPIFLALISLWLVITACQSPISVMVDLGVVTPTPTPDLFSHYRGNLQPWAQSDIEAVSPLPRYHITAHLDESKTSLQGVMQLSIPSPASEIVFRLYPNLDHYNGSIDVTRVLIDGAPGQITSLANDSAIQLDLSPTSEFTAPVIIDMAFETQLGQVSKAKQNYSLFGWDGPVLTLPGFFPMLAVRQDNGWVLDQPPLFADVIHSEVALYQLDITLPDYMVVAGSGVIINVIDNPDQSRTWQITGGPLRDMTIIAGPFLAVSETAAGATVTSYYLPGHEAAGLAVLGHATASLRLYSDTIGPYPYSELDIIEAPLDVRGMEYSGLVLIGTELYDDQREYLTFLVAHEIGHQWWYALVGNNPYQYPWLDEGLTEYGAFDYYRSVFGNSQAEQLLTGRWRIPFANASSGGIDGPVDRPAVDFDPTSYQLLVYSKAALFFNALREDLGDEMYQQVLQTYFEENRYRIATPQIFLATAERVSGQNLNPLAERWLR